MHCFSVLVSLWLTCPCITLVAGGVSVLPSDKPSLELCKSLIMLRDYSISGRISLFEIPALLLTLHSWRVSPPIRALLVGRSTNHSTAGESVHQSEHSWRVNPPITALFEIPALLLTLNSWRVRVHQSGHSLAISRPVTAMFQAGALHAPITRRH